MINLKIRKPPETVPQDTYSIRFQESIFTSLSEVIFSDQLDKSTISILSGIKRAFNGEAFLFKRSGASATLIRHTLGNPGEVAGLLRKAGIRFSVDRIPLSGGRSRAFETPFAEFEDLFSLIGDATTSAACRKIQNDLRFHMIASAAVQTESEILALVAVLPDKPPTLRQDLGRFALILKAAYYLSARTIRLKELETRFDEQVVNLKNELNAKESSHLYLFNEMTIAAAVLDEHGIVTEANEALKRLVGRGVNPLGQAFSSLIDEEGRRDFVELFVKVGAGQNATTSLRIFDRHFKAHIVTRKRDDGERGISVVYLADDTTDVELQGELGRTIDALRAEKEMAERIAAEAREYSQKIVRDSVVPTLIVSGDVITVTSGSLRSMFDVSDGDSLGDFLLKNGLSLPSDDESVAEISDPKRRVLSVARRKIAGDTCIVFDDITEFRKGEEELRRSAAEVERLFNGFLPTAVVNYDRISKWNDMFGSVFKDFISSDGSFDGFLRYLGESPEAFRNELRTGGVIMRMCRTTDRKYLNVSAATAGNATYLFIEDITEQENLKLQLRAAQGLLSSTLESSAEEPLFVVENGFARAANIAARNKLSIRLDEQIDPAKILQAIGIARPDDTGEINGQFFRVERNVIGGTEVYRFKVINQEVAHRAEIDRLKRRQEILRDLSAVDGFEGILLNLNDLLKTDISVSAKVIGSGILQIGRGTADVYLMTVASGKIDPSLSLSLTESDIAAVKRGGALSGIEIPDTTFMNVISAGDSILAVQSTFVGDSCGFASIALPSTGLPPRYVDDLAPILKAASSVAAGLHARMSAERKFEDSGKVTRATVGLTGMGDGSFEDLGRRSIDLLRQVFAAESAGIYSLAGASMTLLISNGELPGVLSVPATRFGSLTQANQLESSEMKSAEGFYFAVRSRPQNLALLLRFIGVSPSVSELNAVSAVALDILESKRITEDQSKITEQLVANSKTMSEFMTRLSRAATADEIVKVLGDSLEAKAKEASVSIRAGEAPAATGHPMEAVERQDDGLSIYEADFSNVGLGVLTVRCSPDPLSRTFVELAVDKLRSISAMKLPAAQAESASLRSRLDRVKEDHARLQESVEKIPASLRNARIGIDNVLSRLTFVQGDEKIMQEIRLHLASAAKEISIDLDNSSRNQAEFFEAVRAAVMKPEVSGQGAAPLRIRSFETSVFAEFRVDQATFDLLKDLFSNFILASGVTDCEVFIMTALPGPGDAAEGKGKHVSMKLKTPEGEAIGGEGIKESASLRTMAEKLQKLGYHVDANVLGNEVTLDVYEMRTAETAGESVLSAILVEDDKKLVEEESQSLLQVFSRVKVAGDAVEASKFSEVEKFNVAFIDLSLPSINGREVCRQMKQSQPECVTVLLTNREGEEKSDGVDHIALRPLDEDLIRSYLRQ